MLFRLQIKYNAFLDVINGVKSSHSFLYNIKICIWKVLYKVTKIFNKNKCNIAQVGKNVPHLII